MIGIKVKDTGDNLKISWLFTKVVIPKSDIIEVYYEETYGEENEEGYRIGIPLAPPERIVVRTKKEKYILYTNQQAIKDKVEAMVQD